MHIYNCVAEIIGLFQIAFEDFLIFVCQKDGFNQKFETSRVALISVG